MRRLSLSCASLATALALAPQGASADPTEAVLQYAAQSVAITSDGKSSLSEILTLQQNPARSIVTVADMSGAALSLPTNVLADGEIVSNASDPGVSCYNNAKSLMASSSTAKNNPGGLFVHLGSDVVRIPIPVEATRQTPASISYSGVGTVHFDGGTASAPVPVRMLATVSIVANGDNIEQAVITTDTFAGKPDKLVGRIACSLTSLTRPPAPQTLDS